MLSTARPHAAVIDFLLIIRISGNAAAWPWVVIRVSVGHGPSGSCDGRSRCGSADQPGQGQRRAPGTCAPAQRRDRWGSHKSTLSTLLPSGSHGPPRLPPCCAGWWRSRPAWAHPPVTSPVPFPVGTGAPSTPEQPRNHGPVRGGAEERPLHRELGRTGPEHSRHPSGTLGPLWPGLEEPVPASKIP